MSSAHTAEEPAEETGEAGDVAMCTGFLCPACPGVVKLESEELLRNHWATLHSEVVEIEHTGDVLPPKVRCYCSFMCTPYMQPGVYSA